MAIQKKMKISPFALAVLIALFFLSLPLTLVVLQKQQETRSRAQQTTTLSFLPESSRTTPLQYTVGQTANVDLMINPGSNLVSFVRLEILYDATKVQATDGSFILNANMFPQLIEGPYYNNGKILVSFSVGSDIAKAIGTSTRVGTFTFKMIGTTSRKYPTMITVGSGTQVLSVAPTDDSTENVLTGSKPIYFSITSQSSDSINWKGGKKR